MARTASLLLGLAAHARAHGHMTVPARRDAYWVDSVGWDGRGGPLPHNWQQSNHPFTYFAPETPSGEERPPPALRTTPGVHRAMHSSW
mmetsp:Transcript_6234/g.14394  ORF Transcript_6234/g.14394 Transcript_6234/m.14394 type:complete len:88 (-) Transcript_6234:1503-1766(-)